MTAVDFIVPAKSWADIANIATNLRRSFGLANEPNFPVMEFIEKVLDQRLNILRFEVGEYDDMDGAEGLTDPRGEFITIRGDVYEKAYAGDGRARFTAAHELGHFLMHTNIPLARAPVGHRLPKYRLGEAQANQFAAELLMPRIFFSKQDTERIVAARHGVSLAAANNRLSSIRGSLL